MAKMASWKEVNDKIGSSGTPVNKCPTKSEVESTGKGTITGTVGSNQLVDLTQVKQTGIGSWEPYVGNNPYTDAVILNARGSNPTKLMNTLRFLPKESGVSMTPESKGLKEVKTMVDFVNLGNKVVIAYALTLQECNAVIAAIRNSGGDAEHIYNYPA